MNRSSTIYRMRCLTILFFLWQWASFSSPALANGTSTTSDFQYDAFKSGANQKEESSSSELPNIVILFADNLGYQDVGWFQNRLHGSSTDPNSLSSSSLTPNIDRLGQEGMTFYNWNSAAHLCSASRAALLTGKYPVRTGIYPRVFRNDAMYGLMPDETTLPELLKQHGVGASVGSANGDEDDPNTSSRSYATSIVGKWHLGHRTPYLPTNQGFDEWIGIPYHMSGGSIDNHTCNNEQQHHVNFTAWLPLYKDTEIIQQPVQIDQLAETYASSAVNFIRRHASEAAVSAHPRRTSGSSSSSPTRVPTQRKQPFFLYMAFSHVHQLCAPRDYPEQMTCQWSSSSSPSSQAQPLSPFDSAVQEMDWIAGQILQALDDTNATNSTIVLFTSDNGPWVAEQSCSGSKGPFAGKWLQDNVAQGCTACPHDYVSQPTADRPRRCVLPNNPSLDLDGVHCGEDTGLGSVWEANLRMPAMVRFPPRVPIHSSTSAMISTLDVVPTLLAMIDDYKNSKNGKNKETNVNDQHTDTQSNSAKGSTQKVSSEILDELDGRDASRIWYGEQDDWDGERDGDNGDGNYDRVLYFWRDGFSAGGGPLPPPYGRMDVAAVKVGRIKLWFWTKSAHYNDDDEAYHDPPLLFDVLDDPAESKPLDPAFHRELIERAKQLVEDHKATIDWGLPLALASDSKYLPCVNQSTDCRTTYWDKKVNSLVQTDGAKAGAEVLPS